MVDGNLDADVWRTAPSIELQQQNPHPGQPTAFRTEVRVLRDDDHLYFGITCIDPELSKIAVHTLQLDGDQSNDDAISIVLDAFGRKKLAYVFQVNAAGAMADGLLSPGSVSAGNASSGQSSSGNSGQNGVVNYYWNGYWQAVVRHTATGWTAEIVIDTRSLQFDSRGSVWGFNVARYVPREQLTLVWSGINLNASVFNLQWEGTLSDVGGLQQGNGFEFDPYGLAKYDDARPGTTTKGGFDLKYDFTPELAGLFTYNTDFSEAPAVLQQSNTTRFALFTPEQRSFFLNGSNIYDFSHNLGQNFVPFDSQRIGLIGADVVPLDEGVKLFGQAGPWTVGILDTQMGSTGVSSAANLFAGRASYNVSDEWRVGMLATHGDPTGASDNTFSGFDSTWSTSTFAGDKTLNVSGWAGHSSGNLNPGNANGYGFDVEYPNDLWNADLNYNYYGDALDPALGFLPRPGTKQYYGQLNYQPRPDVNGSLGWIRQFLIDTNYTFVTGLDDHVQSENFNVYPVKFVTQTGWGFVSQLNYEYDSIPAPFSLLPNVAIPTGNYGGPAWALHLNSPQSKETWLLLATSGGRLYDGKYKVWRAELFTSNADGSLTADLMSHDYYFYMAAGHGTERLITATVTYSFTPDLSLGTLAQYNNIRRGIGTNMRLQWRIEPNRYLYCIWNHGVAPTSDVTAPVPDPHGNQLIVKMVWGFY
ncbi:MAG TPA: carbohydrate binding family 9 domain-containing protein [Gammaproteobacteria bacterium]|nr:carbohydrate binding family 9 domain-containing protein [Gammaproteobacteria bacterium]